MDESLRLHLIYRTYDGENERARPSWYSKAVALRSCLASAIDCQELADITILCDSPTMPVGFPRALNDFAPETRPPIPVRVEYLGGIGNTASSLRSLELACRFPPRDLIYISEDDYLFEEAAFTELCFAAKNLPNVSYFSLYDHPDRYRREDDRRRRVSKPVMLAGHRHWRFAESTCMSFAARVETLRQDRWVQAALARKANIPRDRRLWHILQSPLLGPRRRLLVTPIPSLATHAARDDLAPIVDWIAVAARYAGL